MSLSLVAMCWPFTPVGPVSIRTCGRHPQPNHKASCASRHWVLNSTWTTSRLKSVSGPLSLLDFSLKNWTKRGSRTFFHSLFKPFFLFFRLSAPSSDRSSSAFLADTKRKVEQISEELKSLDEMLAGNGGAAETLDVKEEVSPELTHDPNQSEEKGLCYSTRLSSNNCRKFAPTCNIFS